VAKKQAKSLKVYGTRPFKKGMVQWENTDRNDTV
jgi:hypothetical protein